MSFDTQCEVYKNKSHQRNLRGKRICTNKLCWRGRGVQYYKLDFVEKSRSLETKKIIFKKRGGKLFFFRSNSGCFNSVNLNRPWRTAKWSGSNLASRLRCINFPQKCWLISLLRKNSGGSDSKSAL
eukprot:UN02258